MGSTPSLGQLLTNTVRTIEAFFPGTKTTFAIRARTSGAALLVPCVAACDELSHELLAWQWQPGPLGLNNGPWSMPHPYHPSLPSEDDMGVLGGLYSGAQLHARTV